ncbi:RING finger protein ETP1 [Smittium mucronatum]|uniref:RING finger protein ETP1 n=1 Tax=Smittium mucronatum TaxID=133383 RepID=A0A1R0GUA9_9FUNG|nr:RING finger protein ETP1 [Smittium mucronatum]
MYYYSIYIETFRFAEADTFNKATSNKKFYFKKFHQDHWTPISQIFNSTDFKNLSKSIKGHKGCKTQKSSNNSISDENFYDILNPKASFKDQKNLHKANKVADYLSKFLDYRIGKITIENYTAQDLDTIPELDELETKFYKIQMGNEPNIENLNKLNVNHEIAIGWDRVNENLDDNSLNNNLETSNIENCSRIDTKNDNINNDSSILNANFGSVVEHVPKVYNKKNSTVVPMGIFEVSPSITTEYELGILHLYRSSKSSISQNMEFYEEKKNQDINSNKSRYSLSNQKYSNNISEIGKVLAVLAVPAYMTPSDFVSYAGVFRKKISQFRVIRNSSTNNYMVIVKFALSKDAKDFYEYFNGKSFSPLEPEMCHVVYLSSIIVSNGALPLDGSPLFFDEPWIKPDSSEDFEPSSYKKDSKLNSEKSRHCLSDSRSTDSFEFMLKNDIMNKEYVVSNIIGEIGPIVKEKNYPMELPTCPVCLERLDTSISGLLTIFCQHTFHSSCLSKWSDNSCPVCRLTQANMFVDNDLFDESVLRIDKANQNHLNFESIKTHEQTSSKSSADCDSNINLDLLENHSKVGQSCIKNNSDVSKCFICGSSSQLWICLICGNVGCGRYNYGHAHAHYLETGHIYSMDLDSQRVWDYVGDGYVHRILLNRSDGKLVELSDPNSETSGLGSGFSQNSSFLYGPSNQIMQQENDSNPYMYEYDTRNFPDSEYALTDTGLSLTSFDSGNSSKLSNNATASHSRNMANESNHGKLRFSGSIDPNLDLVREKLAAVAVEYEQTLKSQLLANSRSYENKILGLQNLCKEYLKKQVGSNKSISNLNRSLETEKKLSNSLMIKLESLDSENKKLKSQVEDLSEQVRDLYSHFAAMTRMQDDKNLSELVQGGSIQIVNQPQKKKKKDLNNITKSDSNNDKSCSESIAVLEGTPNSNDPSVGSKTKTRPKNKGKSKK